MNDVGLKTIAAVSTPYGRGGIAVIRISGFDAVKIAEMFFCPISGKKLSDVPSYHAVYGRIMGSDGQIDDGIAVVFRAPKSYTGEDVVEISCHGGILLSEKVLECAFVNGAAPAGPGEFTQRAFLNGKIGLSEAEAVIGLIDAESDSQIKLSLSNAGGALKKRIDGIYSGILKLLSTVYVGLDYPEEDLEEIPEAEFGVRLKEIYDALSDTAKTYREGKAISEGVKVALLGKPNAGKSSLLNALLGEERAIVTPIPGTTRDVIEEKVIVGKVMLRLSDTAGIRESDDGVEKIGIERALKCANEADLIIGMFDSSKEFDREDERLISELKKLSLEGKSVIIVKNKSDLERKLSFEGTDVPENFGVYEISALSGEGLGSLKSGIEGLYVSGEIDSEKSGIIANARQFASVQNAKEAVMRAIDAFESGMGSDVCGLDLESALASLGELDGRQVSSEIVDSIFHNFCVGK